MIKFLTTTGINHYLEQLLKNAYGKIILISPYIKIQKRLKDILLEKKQQGVEIVFVCRKKDLKEPLNQFSNKIIDVPTLHAKCYFCEKGAILTSLNLYEFSQVNNLEMGIYVGNKGEGETLYHDISAEVQRISGIEIPMPKPINKKTQSAINSTVDNKTHHIISATIVDGNTIKTNWKSPMQVIITDKGRFIDNMPGNNFRSKKNAFPGYNWQQKIGQTVSDIMTINSMGFKWLNKKSD